MIVFESLAGRAVGVWGTGLEGRAALAALPASAQRFVIVDDLDAPGVAEAGAEFGAEIVTPDRALAAGLIDIVVRSPGISVHRPEIGAFRARGVVVTSVLELWLPIAPVGLVIGVTGTKGKSTTSQLIAALLVESGRSVEVAGNIGRPVTQIDAVDGAGDRVAVVEVSSYQAADLTVSPQIGVLTNLDVDHLPWHRSIEQYHRDKLTLFANGGLRHLVTTASTLPAVAADGRVDASLVGTPDDAGYAVVDAAPGADGTTEAMLTRHGDRFVDLTGTPLAASHLASDLALACAAAEVALGRPLDRAVVAAVVAAFRLPPGRLEVVPTDDGVTWVDDPLASNPFAASASIRSRTAVPVVLILGGDDRGVDPEPLFASIREHGRVRGVVTIGPAGAVWRERLVAVAETVEAEFVSIDDDDVARAVVEAARIALPGDAVLFSPAAPTTPAVGNWEDRLRAFRDAVLVVAADEPTSREPTSRERAR